MALASLARLLYSRLYPPADPTTPLPEKTVLITGGNTGLGFEAAVKYVSLGVASVIIGCRSEERGQKARELIEQQTQRLGVVQIWLLDMSNFECVKAFADRVNKELPPLDIVLMNAGLYNREYTTSPDGWEETLQVNVLSTILLGLLLLPKLKASSDVTSPGHLSFVSSGTIRFLKLDMLLTEDNLLGHLNEKETFNTMPRYPLSKFLIDGAVRSIADLARMENGQLEVVVNSISPGFCRSNLSRQFNKPHERLGRMLFYFIFGRSSEQGSRTLVSATLQGAESHGKIWKDDHYPEDLNNILNTEEAVKLRKKTWAEITNVLKTTTPQISQLLDSRY